MRFFISPILYHTTHADGLFVRLNTRFEYRNEDFPEYVKVVKVFGPLWRSVGSPFRDRPRAYFVHEGDE